MKSIKAIIIIIFLYTSNCQTQELQGSYTFNTYYKNPITNIKFREGLKVRVIDTIKSEGSKEHDMVSFRVYKFRGKKKNDRVDTLNKTFTYNNDPNDIIVHHMDRKKFNKYTSRVYSRFKGVRAGFYTIPFKLRIDDFDFEQNINFGMNIGFQFRFNRKIENRWLYEPAFGIGLSTINLNTKNSEVNENRTAGAFTTSTGIILHFDKNINLGVFYGLDFLSNNDKEINWKYDRKPWLGLGINVGFSISKSEGTELKNKPQ